MNALKVDRQVVEDDEVRAAEEDKEQRARPDVALGELRWRLVSAA